MLVNLLNYLKYVCVTFLTMLSILCDSIGKYVQAFDDCVVHAFPGTTIERLTFKLKRQPNSVRNAAFVLTLKDQTNITMGAFYRQPNTSLVAIESLVTAVSYELSVTNRNAILKSKGHKLSLASMLCTFILGENMTMNTLDDGMFSHDEADITMISCH